jgi:hypothetical protein
MGAPRKPKPTEERPLISTSSILILSGFLIGITVGKLVAEDLSPYVLACGLSGFLAYIALDIAATRREEEAAAEEIRHMHGRLDRHVLSVSNGGAQMSAKSDAVKPGTLDSILSQIQPGEQTTTIEVVESIATPV